MSYRTVSYDPKDYTSSLTNQMVEDAINALSQTQTVTTATGYTITWSGTGAGTLTGGWVGTDFSETKEEPKHEPGVLDFSGGKLRCSVCHKVNPTTAHIRSHMNK